MQEQENTAPDGQLERELAKAGQRMTKKQKGQKNKGQNQLEDILAEAAQVIKTKSQTNDGALNHGQETGKSGAYIRQLETLGKLFVHSIETLSSVAIRDSDQTVRLDRRKEAFRHELEGFKIDSEVSEEIRGKLSESIDTFLKTRYTEQVQEFWLTAIEKVRTEEGVLFEKLKSESEKFGTRVTNLKEELDGLRNQIKNTEEEITSLREQESTLRKSLEVSQTKISELQDERNRIKTDLESSQTNLNDQTVTSSETKNMTESIQTTDQIGRERAQGKTDEATVTKPEIFILPEIREPFPTNTPVDTQKVTTTGQNPHSTEVSRQLVDEKMTLEKVFDHIVLLDQDLRYENQELEEVIARVTSAKKFKDAEATIVDILKRSIEAIRRVSEEGGIDPKKELTILEKNVEELDHESQPGSPIRTESNSPVRRQPTKSRGELVEEEKQHGSVRGIAVFAPQEGDRVGPTLPASHVDLARDVKDAEQRVEEALNMQGDVEEKDERIKERLTKLRMFHEKITDNIAIHKNELDRLNADLEAEVDAIKKSETQVHFLDSIGRFLKEVRTNLDHIQQQVNVIDTRHHHQKHTEDAGTLGEQAFSFQSNHETTPSAPNDIEKPLLSPRRQKVVEEAQKDRVQLTVSGPSTPDPEPITNNIPLSEDELGNLIDKLKNVLQQLNSQSDKIHEVGESRLKLLQDIDKLNQHTMFQEEHLKKLAQTILESEEVYQKTIERKSSLDKAVELLEEAKILLSGSSEVADIVQKAETVINDLNHRVRDFTSENVDLNTQITLSTTGEHQHQQAITTNTPSDNFQSLDLQLSSWEERLPINGNESSEQKALRKQVVKRLHDSLSKIGGKIDIQENQEPNYRNHRPTKDLMIKQPTLDPQIEQTIDNDVDVASSRLTPTREKLVRGMKVHNFTILVKHPMDSTPDASPSMKPIDREKIQTAIDKLVSVMDKQPQNVKDIRSALAEFDTLLLTHEKLVENIMWQEEKLKDTKGEIKRAVKEIGRDQDKLKLLKKALEMMEGILAMVQDKDSSDKEVKDMLHELEDELNSPDNRTADNQIASSVTDGFDSLRKYLEDVEAKLSGTEDQNLREQVVKILSDSISKIGGKIQGNVSTKVQNREQPTPSISSSVEQPTKDSGSVAPTGSQVKSSSTDQKLISKACALYLGSTVKLLHSLSLIFAALPGETNTETETISHFLQDLVVNNEIYFEAKNQSESLSDDVLEKVFDKEETLQTEILKFVENWRWKPNHTNSGRNSYSQNTPTKKGQSMKSQQ